MMNEHNLEATRISHEEQTMVKALEKKSDQIQDLERLNLDYRAQIDGLVTKIEELQKDSRGLELQISKLRVERDILATEKKSNTEEVDIISSGYKLEMEKLLGKIKDLREENDKLRQ